MNVLKGKSVSKSMLLAGCSVSAIALMTANLNVATAQQIEEIVVTATKRATSIQDVPIAITAFDAAFIDRVNLVSVKDLIKFAPGFTGNSKDSFVDFINVRGISTNDFGNGGDPSIGIFKNGLYQGRTGSAVTSLYDLERAEMLRGPQGFLFGRNAVSGAISFHTKKPDFDSTSGYVSGSVGGRGILEAEAAVNLPLGDNFAIRVAGYTSHENGWITNTFMPAADKLGGHDTTAGRISASFKGESWDATLIAEYEDKETAGTVYRAVEGAESAILVAAFGADIMPGPDLRTIHSNIDLGNYDRAEIFSLTSEINVDLGFATLTSLTGYKDHNYQYAEDYDGMSLAFYDYSQDQEGNYFEQELRLVSESDGPLSWYAGASFFKENIDTTFFNRADEDAACGAYYHDLYGYNTCADLYAYWEYWSNYYGYYGYYVWPGNSALGLLEGNRIVGSYKGWGAYLDMTYALTDKFDISVGVRYSKNTKNFSIHIFDVDSALGPWLNYGVITPGLVGTTNSWDDFTPRFIARYRPNDNTMFYASVTKGFKSGGFNSLGVIFETDVDGLPVNVDANGRLTDATPDGFDPETVWSYEIGVKGNTADNRVRYDLTAYHYRYKDLQLNFWDSGVKVDNVGRVKAYGVEASIQAALSENFDVLLAGAYNANKIYDAESITPGSDGNRLPGTPEFMASGMLTFHTPITSSGELNASVDFAAQSSSFVSGLGNIPDGRLDSWADVSLRLGYESDAGWSVTGYVENVFSDIYFDGGYEGGDRLPTVVFGASRPRTFGLRFSMKFGE